LDVGLFLGIFAFVYHMTERARMIAIESLADRDAQRLLLGVLYDHCRPCDRLKDKPVQTNCQRKRNDQQYPAK
jgi:hypothetical protein